MQIDLALLTQLVASPHPLSLITPLVLEEIRRYDVYFDDHERAIELRIICTYYEDLLAVGKDQLQLTIPKLTALLQLGHSLIRFASFSRSDLADKDYKQELAKDIRAFQERLKSMQGFARTELQAVTEYFFRTYFQHYRLYHYLYSGKQASETKILEITVETPLPSEPLAASVQRLKIVDIEKSPEKFISRSSSISQTRRPSTRLSDPPRTAESRQTKEPMKLPEAVAEPNELEQTIAKAEAEFTQLLKQRQELLDKQLEDTRKKLKK